jgi:omega-6 fatty acid desaturase (delta-12 desaturase)
LLANSPAIIDVILTKKMQARLIMNQHSEVLAAPAASAQQWVRILANYREPNATRSWFELAVTLVPFVGLWAVAWLAMSISPWLALLIAALNGMFLVRLFAIQHDCGHGAFFKNGTLSDWVGRALGVLTLTPYDVWRRAHSIHHSSSGNLDTRGFGDIVTLTLEEYHARDWVGRMKYRVYRNPLMLFVIGPAYMFFLQHRIPLGFMKSGWKYWTSAMGTNIGIAVILLVIGYFGGIKPLLLIFLPTTAVAASFGVWLFYVQHQFEEAHWDVAEDWQLHEAALHGSSHYVMPKWLQWMTANIGIHHVHHLYSRIPYYRLTEVLRDHKELATAQRLTIGESFRTAGLQLWDTRQRRLLSFRQARAQYGRF